MFERKPVFGIGRTLRLLFRGMFYAFLVTRYHLSWHLLSVAYGGAPLAVSAVPASFCHRGGHRATACADQPRRRGQGSGALILCCCCCSCCYLAAASSAAVDEVCFVFIARLACATGLGSRTMSCPNFAAFRPCFFFVLSQVKETLAYMENATDYMLAEQLNLAEQLAGWSARGGAGRGGDGGTSSFCHVS